MKRPQKRKGVRKAQRSPKGNLAGRGKGLQNSVNGCVRLKNWTRRNSKEVRGATITRKSVSQGTIKKGDSACYSSRIKIRRGNAENNENSLLNYPRKLFLIGTQQELKVQPMGKTLKQCIWDQRQRSDKEGLLRKGSKEHYVMMHGPAMKKTSSNCRDAKGDHHHGTQEKELKKKEQGGDCARPQDQCRNQGSRIHLPVRPKDISLELKEKGRRRRQRRRETARN